VFAVGVLLGAVATAWAYSHNLRGQMGSKSVDIAFKTAEQAEWLALLRLNESTNLVQQLERSMMINLLTVAQWDEVGRMNREAREQRNRFLTGPKVYYRSFPPEGEEAKMVSSFLAEIPNRDPKKVCNSGICRLDDHRAEVPDGQAPASR
jgi:hypothetical protein